VKLDGTIGAYTFVLVATADPIPFPEQLEQAGLDNRGALPERWWVERVTLEAR